MFICLPLRAKWAIRSIPWRILGAGFGFEFEGAALVLRDDAEAGLYTLSVLAQDGSPQPQESRVSVTVLVIEDVVLAVGSVDESSVVNI